MESRGVSLALSAIMVVGMSITTFAAEVQPAATTVGTFLQMTVEVLLGIHLVMLLSHLKIHLLHL